MSIGIVFISGFREGERASSGSELLHRRLEADYDADARVYDLRPWNCDTVGLASLMQRDGIRSAIVLGYSWGGGYGAQRLIEELKERGIPVPLLLLCDAVYRPTWLPTWLPANVLALRAMLPGSAKIDVSSNVRRVAGIYQRTNRPAGHPLKIGPATTLGPWRELKGWRHTEIDEAPQWGELVQREIEQHLTKEGLQ